ncbi:MAG: S1C family serine protease [Solirubrobacteraceae bacterium]
MPASPLRSRTAGLLAAAALVGGGGGAAVATAISGGGSSRTSTTTVVRDAGSAAPVAATSGGTPSATAIYRAAAPSVVGITAQVSQQSSSPFQDSQSGTATGTGFVVGANGLIATNAHVVDNASSIRVTLADGRKRTATLVGKDDSTDVALLRISASGLKPLTFADSSSVAVGAPVFAIGNPFGLDRTLTTGVISALNRDITAPNGFAISGALQTDAALNPGNSGGPLLDASGGVIGINSQIESSSQNGSSQGGNTGIGFAVPSNVVKRVVSTLAEGGTVRHGYLGVSSGDASGGGAQIGQVASGGPADRAGLRAGDVIVRVGSTNIADAAALGTAIDRTAPGTTVTLQIRRGGQTQSVDVKIASRPAQASAG